VQLADFITKGCRGHLNAGGGWAFDFWVPSVKSTDHVDRWIIVKQEKLWTKIGLLNA
jgi:hypothetical protein